MPDVTCTHPFLDVFLLCVPKNVRSVLDVGCGKGTVGAFVKIHREPERLVGIDVFDPYLSFCKKIGVYTEIIRLDLQLVPLPFKVNEFDLSVALEVLEHLPKADGRNLLSELERVSRRIIVSTPNRYFHQAPYDGNIHQQHLSKWTVSDFKERGYVVLGVGGLMFFGRQLRYLSYVLGRTTLPFPRFSSLIMGIYSKDDPHPSFYRELLQYLSGSS